MTAGLRVERRDDVLELVLDRPAVRNALDEALIAALTRALREDALASGLRLVLVRGVGPVFCAGADLAYMRRMAGADEATNLEDAVRLSALFNALYTCPRPVVAAVQGAAMGGGVGLVAAADLAIAAPDAQFGFTEVRLGIVPGVISPFALRRLGPAVARRLFLTGEIFDARAALRYGLIDEIAAEGQLEASVDAALERLRVGGPQAQSATKLLLEEVTGVPIADAVARTPAHIARQRATAEAREGLAAFFEKRRAAWMPPKDSSGGPS